MPEPVLAATTIGTLRTEIREYPFPKSLSTRAFSRLKPRASAEVTGARINAMSLRASWGMRMSGAFTASVRSPRGAGESRKGTASRWKSICPAAIAACAGPENFACANKTEARRPDALRYGTTPVSEAPGLWGGYSQFQYLHPNSVLHRVPEHVPAELAAMCLPIANGIQWTWLDGRAGPGKAILSQGPGQQGLACAFAAKAAGADCVVVSGLTRDAHRLEIAKALGADYTINAEQDDLEGRMGEITGGQGVDICVDAAGASGTWTQALRLRRRNGTVLFAAAPMETPPDFRIADRLARRLTLRPCRGHGFESVDSALKYVASGRYPLQLMATHRFSLADTDLAIRSVGGQGAPGAVHVAVLPWS
jgi:threonine dehydrogenase-like Zn-dependent dehydrogenase